MPPDVEQARIVAEARFRYPLNLGDCFAYALAIIENVRSSPRIRISGK
ncbi:MAG TPA: type II toxin-antitoxin system VapC family toxin [Thermoanaerobaculia bacterium]|nr:type II toxin-antitoxin system VapC family toxin [Thermoanaerobaculia bacterium]